MNKTKLSKLDWAVITVALAIFLYFASRLITGNFFWYDEGVQFYIAKGLGPYSEKFVPYSGLHDVLFYNRYFNRDPGGFGVLLHFWSMISNHYIWLRLLPFVFYVLTLYFSFKVTLRHTNSFISAVLVTSIFMIHPVFAIETCELRGYSMEMLAVMASLYCIDNWDNNWSCKRLLILAVILSVFMTSRYSVLIYAFCVSLYIAWRVFKQDKFKAIIVKGVLYGGILLMTITAIWLLSMQYHLLENGVGYVEGGYLGRHLLTLLSPSLIRFYVLIGILVYDNKKGINTESFLTVAIIVSIVFVLLSAFNLYPIDERRSMSLTTVQTFAICLAVIMRVNNIKIITRLKWGCIVAAIGAIVVFPYLNKGRSMQDRKYASFKQLLSELKPGETVFVHRYVAPGVKYMFEEGELKTIDRNMYEKQIYLAKDKTHSQCEYDLHYEIIAPEDYNATYYVLQKLGNMFVIDEDIFEPYKNYYDIYKRK